LKHAVEAIVDRGIAQSPTLTVVKRARKEAFGNVSENKKGLKEKIQ